MHIGIVIVPQQRAYVIERFGKFSGLLQPGLHFLIPLVDRIAYIHSLKEEAVTIGEQTAITKDNVTIRIDGVLYYRVVDPEAASYGVEDALFAITQLAQTTMRSELGKMTLDKTFEERESLNERIVQSINQAAGTWGVECLRYEIKDITPPESVSTAMTLEAEAERRKRASILKSEGDSQAVINRAEGNKRQAVLQAEGMAEQIRLRANAHAESLRLLTSALSNEHASSAASLQVAEQYITAFRQLAKEGTTVILPADVGNPSAMVANALATFTTLSKTTSLPPVTGKGTPFVHPEPEADNAQVHENDHEQDAEQAQSQMEEEAELEDHARLADAQAQARRLAEEQTRLTEAHAREQEQARTKKQELEQKTTTSVETTAELLKRDPRFSHFLK